MTCVLFFGEVNAMGRDFAYVDRLLTMFGIIPIVIDRTLTESTHYAAHFYPSLHEAVGDSRWDGYRWIWLDADAEQTLEELEYSGDNIIYCVGSDADGFGGVDYPGDRVSLPFDIVNDQTYATLVIPVLCGHHRWGR